MMENRDISLEVKQVHFTKNSIRITDLYSGKHQILYKELMFACLSVSDRRTGACYEPEITEITENMEGDLLLYDTHRCCWRLKTNFIGKTAGMIFKELACNAPYMLLGGHPWLDIKNDKDFAEIKNMVSLMREC